MQSSAGLRGDATDEVLRDGDDATGGSVSHAAEPSATGLGERKLSLGLALALAGLTLFGYLLFNYFRVGDDLYAWSKTLAGFDVRQHLGMSKRWALQYGHLVFLFALLVLSKYLLVWDRTSELFSRIVTLLDLYTLPVFVFHFPLLYFFAALLGHDASQAGDQITLFVVVLVACIALGKLCFLIKPLCDRLQRRLVSAVATQQVRWDEVRPLTRSHSEGLRLMRVVAMLSIYFGHFTFTQFSAATLPGFDHWQRWSIPFFFMLAGYFAMRSLSLRSYGALADIVDRYVRLWYIVLPMLLVVPILDHVGFDLDPSLYYLHAKFVSPSEGGPTDVVGFLATVFNSLLYLNEIFLYNWLGLGPALGGTELGGVRTFSNDVYWFLCYLMPFTAMLAVMVNHKGPGKYVWLLLLAVFFGPPILMLSPLFFAGCFAYVIHQRV